MTVTKAEMRGNKEGTVIEDRLASQRSRSRCKRGSLRLLDFRHCSVCLCSYERFFFFREFRQFKVFPWVSAVSHPWCLPACLLPFHLVSLHTFVFLSSLTTISSPFIHTAHRYPTSYSYISHTSSRSTFTHLPRIQHSITLLISLIPGSEALFATKNNGCSRIHASNISPRIEA